MHNARVVIAIGITVVNAFAAAHGFWGIGWWSYPICIGTLVFAILLGSYHPRERANG